MVSLHQLLFLLLASSSTVNATVDIVDATKAFVKSTESTFDHEVTLMSDDSQTLTFHWNDIRGNTVEGRLIHIAQSIEQAPSWLGFGIYDTFANPDPVTSSTPVMVGSDAIIGMTSTKSVLKYELGGKAVSESGDGVHPAEHQTLINSGMIQHLGDDGTVTTDLSFEKLLEESNPDEVRIRHVGSNVFLWALGSPEEEALSVHVSRGVFTLDLTKVQEIAEAGGTSALNGDNDEEDASGEEAETSDSNTAPSVVGQCDSEYEETDMMVELTPTLCFHWKLNVDVSPPSLTVIVESDGEGWVGLGFSANGKMIGSTAVIGVPGESQEAPQKYDLNDRTLSAVVPSSSQTLEDASVTQAEGKTILAFTKVLNEGSSDEVTLNADGFNTFIYAVGSDNELAYHEHRGSFTVDLTSCGVQGSPSNSSSSSNMGIWIAHGVFAILAWAVASPFAITVAWFRTLVPSSWIYIHVFAHVISYIFSLIAVMIAIAAMSKDSFPSHFSEPHHWVGLVLLVAMTFQVMSGFLRPPVDKKDPYASTQYENDESWIKIPRTPRELWFFTHRLSGISMLGMGIYQITSGLSMFADRFNVESMGYWSLVYFGCFGGVLLLLKLWIMFEEYKARKGMAAISAVDNQGMGGPRGMQDESQRVQY